VQGAVAELESRLGKWDEEGGFCKVAYTKVLSFALFNACGKNQEKEKIKK